MSRHSRASPSEMLMGVRVVPSILSADFGRLREQVIEVLDAGARIIHVDVMDGHFVPPITVGPLIVEALAESVSDAGAMIEVHLMIERPERHVAEFVKAGAQSVTFHATRATTMGRPRYHATVVVSPKEYGITRRGTTKPVKVILDATLKRA